jgi:hypothetical protein
VYASIMGNGFSSNMEWQYIGNLETSLCEKTGE